jgi:hypothetical protein
VIGVARLQVCRGLEVMNVAIRLEHDLTPDSFKVEIVNERGI